MTSFLGKQRGSTWEPTPTFTGELNIRYVYVLTIFYRVDSPTLMLWTGPFPVEGMCDYLYYYHLLQTFLYVMLTV